jgi:hypothetical protein
MKVRAHIEVVASRETLIDLLNEMYDAQNLVEKDGKVGVMKDHFEGPWFQEYLLAGSKEVLALYRALTKKEETK